MKTLINHKKGSHKAWSPYSLPFKGLILIALIFAGIQNIQAQDTTYTRPSWWFGAAAGANLNFYQGSTQEINADLMVPAAFHDGSGVGLYLAPLLEYHEPDTRLGGMLQIGYDNRKGTFDQVISPCNCPEDLKANPKYITIEPSIRLAPFKGDFYLYAGPRLALNLNNSFTYQQGIDPAYPDQDANPEVEGDFSNTNKSLLSMQIGAGYDIQLSSQEKEMQWALSPFVSYHPYFGQNPRSIETWNMTTIRIGATLKFGKGKKIEEPVEQEAAFVPVVVPVVAAPTFTFTVKSPGNIPVDRRVRETFPLRNYIFFDLGSTDIPDRYVLLNKGQVKDFKEDQLEVFAPKKLSGRSDREMIVYYNVLNILGDRMQKNPATTIKLVGSSEKGPEDAKLMAQSVKTYLVDVFAINASRITVEGRSDPKIPSEQAGAEGQMALFHQDDRRVSIESSSPVLLMEFQSGPDAPLKPVEIVTVQEAPIDSYVTFNVDGADEAFKSWSLAIRDEKGTVQKFGPYTEETVVIPGKSILGSRTSGNYTATMIGTTKIGKTMEKDAPLHIVLWTPSEDEQGMRFSVIFEFNDSRAITIYDKYLSEVVTPKIPKNGTVIIHGHTDLIGDAEYNKELSLARANEVKDILEKAVAKAGRKDVKFETIGFGEDSAHAPFGNVLPEERFYNRTVIIDLIPEKK